MFDELIARLTTGDHPDYGALCSDGRKITVVESIHFAWSNTPGADFQSRALQLLENLAQNGTSYERAELQFRDGDPVRLVLVSNVTLTQT